MMMRVAFVIDEFPSVTQTFILNQITGLIDRGHSVEIYPAIKNHTTDLPVNVYKYKLNDISLFKPQIERNLKGVFQALTRYFTASLAKDPKTTLNSLNCFRFGRYALEGPLFLDALPFIGEIRHFDIIHAHFGINGLRAMRLQDLGVVKGNLITTFHGYDISKHIRKYGSNHYRQLFEKGDYFLTVSHHFKEQLIKLGCEAQKIAVHRSGVDLKVLSSESTNIDVTINKPIDDKRIKIVTIARFVEKKGLEYGIRAVSRIKGKAHEIIYNIIGDGELRTRIESCIQNETLQDTVELLGWMPHDQIIHMLKNADILLAPSVTSRLGDKEGIPVTIIEAMAMGLPVVSTHHSGIPELVEDGINGFLVPERDVKALAQKLVFLIDHPEKRIQMGKAGRKRIETDFDIEHLNDRLVEIYEKLIKDII